MIYAQIDSGQIQNTITLKDDSLLPLFQVDPLTGNPFDYVIRVDMMYPQPGIGWAFDGIAFYPPVQPEDDD